MGPVHSWSLVAIFSILLKAEEQLKWPIPWPALRFWYSFTFWQLLHLCRRSYSWDWWTLIGAQSKGMCLWWLLSHRSWQAGEMWRGRFTRIKWACLTFLICTSGSLTETANLELKEKRPSPPITGDTPNRKRRTLVCEQGSLPSVVRAPRCCCCCIPSHTRTWTAAHMVLFISIKPTEPLRSLYFSAAWFICSSCRSAFLPPPVPSLSFFLCLLQHVVFIQQLLQYLQDLWKVGWAVTSSCHESTVQIYACVLTRMLNSVWVISALLSQIWILYCLMYYLEE